MARLRKSTMAMIFAALDESRFTLYDFSVSFPQGDNGDAPPGLVEIAFLHDRHYAFAIRSVPPDHFATEETPGRFFERDATFSGTFEACVARIPAWCDRIEEDLCARLPIYDELEELREAMQQEMRDHLRDEELHFGPDEKANLAARLDELAAKFDRMHEQNILTRAELDDVQQQLAAVREDLSRFPRGVWYRTAWNKVFNVVKVVVCSKEGRRFALDAARKFLLGEPGNRGK